MVKVTLKYRKYSWWPGMSVKVVEFPTEWEELNAGQFILAVKILTKGYLGDRDKTVFFNSVLGLKNFPLYNLPQEVLRLTDFMLDITEPFAKVMVPVVEVDGVRYYGPDDGFNNMKIWEWGFTDTQFIEYSKNKSDYLLHRTIAAIYRPSMNDPEHDRTSKDFKGDIREPFNDAIVDERVKVFEKLDLETKAAIIFNFRVIRRWIEDRYPNVFPKYKPVLRVILGRDNKNGWDKFIRNLCNGDLTKLDQAGEIYLHNALTEADEAIEEQNKKG
jgi:hypothetical protein